MSPELESIIKERTTAGAGYEEIEAELIAQGHSKEAIALAYAVVKKKTEVEDVTVSSGTSLFKAGLTFAQSRLDLVVFLGVTSALLNLTLLYSESFESMPLLIGVSVVGFISLLLYAFGLIASYYIVGKAPHEHITITSALSWSVQNILSLWWIFLLAFLLIWAGFILFIIPGIILSFMVYFSQYVYIHEGERGMAAVLRSRAVMLGRVWSVIKRLFVFFLYTILITILVSIPYGLYFGFVEEAGQLSVVSVILELLTQLVTAVLTLAGIAVGNQLFLELRADRPRAEPSVGVIRKYRFLALFGAVSSVGLFVALGVLIWLGYTALPELPVESENGEAVRDEVIFAELIAEEYRFQNGTFEGVCERLVPAVTLADAVECNDSETEWALAAETWSEFWCTDTTGYGKAIAGPLGERTVCLNLPEFMPTDEPAETTTIPEGEIIPVL